VAVMGAWDYDRYGEPYHCERCLSQEKENACNLKGSAKAEVEGEPKENAKTERKNCNLECFAKAKMLTPFHLEHFVHY
jgi:hypothetical protein